MDDQIKIAEQNRLDEVESKLRTAKGKYQKQLKTAEKDEKAIQKNYYNDVRLNTESYSGMMETSVSIHQQQQMLAERRTSYNSASHRLNQIEQLEQRPYFARLDIHENGEDHDEKIYIGLASFTDRPDHYLIYDWRAPIASIYYENKLGDVSYQTPDGLQTVDVKLKRQFQIKDGQIETVYDTEAAVGDQLLLSSLSNQSSTKMKSIVATIQSEQNQIIRDTQNDLLFVQGAAGSGKTAAVLQRIAYLLYRYRGNLNSGQVLLFSPNQLFNDYINQVLPELGEQNMVQMTYYQYASHRLRQFKVETLAQLFRDDNETTGSAKQIHDLKGSLAYFNATDQFIDHLNHRDIQFKNIKFQDQILFSKDQIAEVYYSFNNNYNLRNRITATKETLLKRINRKMKHEMKQKWVEAAIESLSEEQLRAVQMTHPEDFQNPDTEYRFLAKHIVQGAFKRIKQQIIRNRFIAINRQFVHMLRAIPQLLDLEQFGLTEQQWAKGVQHTVNEMKQGSISMADVTPYLFLYDRITGKHGDRDIRYFFIDEVQDYTSYQLAFLKQRFPKARFTLLGDLNQAIFTHDNSETLIRDMSSFFDPDKVRVITLNQSYRSTAEITNYSNAILGPNSHIEPFDRHGPKPALIKADGNQKAVLALKQFIQKHPDETVAVIGKTLNQCNQLYEALEQQNIKSTLLRTENQRLAKGVLIVPAYLAKGLEFDTVVMWDASADNYGQEDDRKLVYTICTRAMHELLIISAGRLTPLLSNIDPKLYDLITEGHDASIN